ncbi:MAG: hypothetical protein C5B47_00880 [Verrucomicrobia bacterium]|nr:MAG: hypothetical protein C5B47_00880 [Verrucomicrobiota bacterium]
MTTQGAFKDLLTKEMRAVLFEIGLMGFGGGFEPEALAYFHKLRLLEPDNPNTALLLAQLHMFSRKFEQAEQVLLEVELSPSGSDPKIFQMIHSLRQSAIQLSKAPAA